MRPTVSRFLSIPNTIVTIDAETARSLLDKSKLDGIVLSDPIALFGDGFDQASTWLSRLRGATKHCVLSVDVAAFPIDHPLVSDHPDHFAIRHEAGGDRAIDPRSPMAPVGSARARIGSDTAADSLADPIIERLKILARAGAAGFLLRERLSAPLWARIAPYCADASVMLLRHGVGGNADGRADAIVVPMPDGVATDLAGVARNGKAPLFIELPAEPVSDVAIELAALIGDGVLVPMEAVRSADAQAKVAASKAHATSREDIAGEVRMLSAPDAMLAVYVRGDADRLAVADKIACMIVNRGSDAIVPDLPGLLQPAGATFAGFVARTDERADAPLPPGAARLLTGRRAEPIAEAIAVADDPAQARTWPRLVIDAVSPSVEGGDFAVKRIVGDTVSVSAEVFTDGHEQLAVELRWRAADDGNWQAARMTPDVNDRWEGTFPLERVGTHRFVVEGWIDRFGGFRRDYAKKRDAGVAPPVDVAEGLDLVFAAADRTKGDLGAALQALHKKIAAEKDAAERGEMLMTAEVADLMARADDRPHALASRAIRVDSERLAARYSSWYELFPRSMTDDKARHGTFADVIDRLPAIRDMGFDTLYFPPIHPIGTANRKGPNNTLTPGPDDVGSPYAIGSEAGGHDAIHPALGGFDDFDRLVAAARAHGLEIALDFAIQCSPDHPWLKEHPGWFAWRPDGSMKYAENPPKKYQDIVNVDFYGPDAVPALWQALRDVVLLWVDHGVKTFRVDNPHTKPLPFWEWMIRDVRARHPDAIFLAEAFTRPTMMYRLAKVGFSQSYTYFTWRDRKQELTEYITELTTTAPKDFYRPHFFVNTPDINPTFLQTSGRPGFRIRAVLAATLSGLFGVYSGFELCESAPLAPGKEEYLDSEKYEIRPRDYEAPGNIIADITVLNRLRRTYPALQTHLNTRFYAAYNDDILWYAKPDADGAAMIMVMVNLDPHNAQECDFEVPLWEFGLADDAGIAVRDLVNGHRFDWYGKVQHIRLAPDEPYRIWRLSTGADV